MVNGHGRGDLVPLRPDREAYVLRSAASVHVLYSIYCYVMLCMHGAWHWDGLLVLIWSALCRLHTDKSRTAAGELSKR